MTQYQVGAQPSPNGAPQSTMPGFYSDPGTDKQQSWDSSFHAPQQAPGSSSKQLKPGRILGIAGLVVVAVIAIAAVVKVARLFPTNDSVDSQSMGEVADPGSDPTGAGGPAPSAVSLQGKGGDRTELFTLTGGTQYRVDYEYSSSMRGGYEACHWYPSLKSVDATKYETLPAGEGAMKGSTRVYPRETTDYYLDASTTQGRCTWSVTLTPAS